MKEHAGQPGYETTDAQTKPLVAFGVGLTVVLLLALWVSSWIVSGFQSGREQQEREHPMTGFREAPEDPVLQANPTAEIHAHRRANEELLQRYGWIDRANGVVHIPVERAKLIILREGLPTRSADEEQEH